MFGDLAGATSAAIVRIDGQAANLVTFGLPIAGGGSRIGKMSENDSPIPQDRVFFNYNHFHNSVEVSEFDIGLGTTRFSQGHLDRYTLGLEKTFFDGNASVELRMPLVGTLNEQLDNVGINADNVGNLTAVVKSLLYMDEALAIGAGMAIETPTGNDLFARLATTRLQFQNETVHLLPYIGFIWSAGDPRWGWGSGLFLTGFAQVDINTGSNAVDVLDRNGVAQGTLGKLTDQNLGFFDVGAGYWLYRDPDAPRLTGIAAITELHYTTSLQDADVIMGMTNDTMIALNAFGTRSMLTPLDIGRSVFRYSGTAARELKWPLLEAALIILLIDALLSLWLRRYVSANRRRPRARGPAARTGRGRPAAARRAPPRSTARTSSR
jgi:hypothetical protein